jgi:hypothetical protein
MLFGVPGLKRILVSVFVLLAGSVALVSCGNSNSSSTAANKGPSKLKFRVFVTNPLLPTGTGSRLPVLNIVDASRDILSLSVISLSGNSTQPQLMALSPNLQFTMIFSPSGNTISLVNNSTESIAQTTGGTVQAITLPGSTESMFIGNANTAGYAAVPTAPVIGQDPGAVVVLNLLNGSIAASIPVPGAHFIVPSPDGNHILVFSDNSDTVTVITTIAIGTSTDPRTYITGFDRPVWGIFNDNTTAYVLNCGPQCMGKAAGVSVLNVNTSSIENTTPVNAATYGLLNGSKLYVAGTPPPNPVGTNTCAGAPTAATVCGRLTVLETGSMTVAGSAIITDGYHDRMQLSQDGQLFIGSHGCSNINILGGEVRGCLSILNTNSSKVVIPPQNGDVTGIQPITGRPVAYVIQSGQFWIYDTPADTLQVIPGDANNNNGQIDVVGQLFDLKLVD